MYLRPFAMCKNGNDASKITSKGQSSSDVFKEHFGWQETSAGFSLNLPKRIKLNKFGGLSWLLHRGYSGAGATLVVILCLPDEGWRQDSKLWLPLFTCDYLKAEEWPQTRCSEIFFCRLCDEGVQVHFWRGRLYIKDLQCGLWLLKDTQRLWTGN